MIELGKGNSSTAKEIIEDTVEKFEEHGDPDGLASAYAELGHVSAYEYEFSEGIDWYTKAVELYYQIENDQKVATTHFNIADCQFKLGNQMSALSQLTIAGRICLEKGLHGLLYPVADYIYDITMDTDGLLLTEEIVWILTAHSVAKAQNDENWANFFLGKYYTSLISHFPDLYNLLAPHDDPIAKQLDIVAKIITKPIGMTSSFGTYSDSKMVLDMLNEVLALRNHPYYLEPDNRSMDQILS
jgi:tetratricopeptide (TPR) repeat protein